MLDLYLRQLWSMSAVADTAAAAAAGGTAEMGAEQIVNRLLTIDFD